MLRLARAFDHRSMKEICEWIVGRRGAAKTPREVPVLVGGLRQTPVQDLAATFCDLQEARHSADYDHLASFSKAMALFHVDEAERALNTLADVDDAARDALFALLALGVRVTRTMPR
jgi:hypothetical protein